MAETEDGMAGAAAAFLHQVRSQSAVLAGGMAVACGAVLVLRRLAGAFAAPPGPEAVLAICGAGLLLVAVGDLPMRSAATRAAGPAMAWVPAVLTRLGLLMGVAAVGLPLRDRSGVDAITTIAAVAVSLATAIRGPVADLIRSRFVHRRPAAAHRRTAVPSAPVPPSEAVPTARSSPPMLQARLPEAATCPPAGNVLQRFERLALPDGAECVRGRLCVTVSKGARAGFGHVGFCPPLASQPTIEVTSDYDGVEANVAAAEVLPWGVRIECRLDEPAEETIEIPVDIFATTGA